jgi:hypothetical protein
VDELDGEIRRMLSEIGDAAGVAPAFDQLQPSQDPASHPPARRRSHSPGLVAAVVLTIAVGLVGIVLFTHRNDESDVTSPSLPASDTIVEPLNSSAVPGPSGPLTVESDPQPPLDTTNAIDLASLNSDSWLLATWLPDGYQIVLAIELGTPDFTAHGVTYENSDGDQIVLTFDMRTAEPGVTAPPTRPWTSEANDDGYMATASNSSSTASISAARLNAVEFNRLFEGVTPATRDDIPSDAFLSLADVTDDDIVATYDHNGFLYVMQADGVNDYYCVKAGGAGGCPLWIEPDQLMTSHGGGSTAAMGGSTTITSSASGIVQPIVDRIEVEFVDGQRISVEPTDLTGRFDHKFWIVATDIELDAPYDPDPGESSPRPVVSVTAYDRDGNVLQVDHGFGET